MRSSSSDLQSNEINISVTGNKCDFRTFIQCRLETQELYLRSTMTQQRLNNLLLLHVHKGRTNALNEVDIGNEFVGDSEHRLRMFGKFH